MDSTTPKQTDFDKVIDYLRAHHTRNSFYASLFQQFERKGTLSEKQIACVMNAILKDAQTARASVSVVTEVGMYRTSDGDVFRVKQSKSGNLYAMRFDPTAPKSERFVYEAGSIFRISASDRMTLAEASAIGAQCGICVVCGAELSDPKSIERGIGPVCAKRV